MVAIGVVTAALVVVLSVFNGFENLVKQMYGDFYPDLQVMVKNGKQFSLTPEQMKTLQAFQTEADIEPVLEERAILLDNEDKSIVWLKGVSEQYASFSGIPGHMLRGEFYVGDSANPRIILGSGVEQSLQIIAGQTPFPITVYLPNPEAGPTADPATAMVSANAYPIGAFAVQQEFDEQYAFTHIDFLKYMLGLPEGQYSAIEVFAHNKADIEKIQRKIAAAMGDNFVVKNRFQQNQALFSAMKTEKLIIYAIAFLILIIAGFNIVSSLTMTVIEKQKDIAVLKALGASDQTIYRIFLQLGVLLAGLGALVGFCLGIIICFGQQKFHWVKLAGQSFIINYYPVAVKATDLFVIAGIVICTALVAAWIPSRRATQTDYSLR